MKVNMVRCDNPYCANTGTPESEDNPKARGKQLGHRLYMAPYGWLQATVYVVGSGPDVSVEACSLECLEKAVRFGLDEARE